MNVEGKRYVGGDFPVHLLTMGKLFNKRLVPCAFGIKIGLYFHETLTKRYYAHKRLYKAICGHKSCKKRKFSSVDIFDTKMD